MTETKTADITVVDAGNYETTFKINNPKSNVTLAQFQAAFAPMISGGYLFSRYGYAFTSAPRGVITLTSKTQLS